MRLSVPLSLALMLLAVVSATAHEAKVPRGFVLDRSTISPDGRYGVLVPMRNNSAKDAIHNRLVEVATGRVVAIIQGMVGFDRMNSSQMEPCRWSADGSLLLWEISFDWGTDTLVLLMLQDGKVLWQKDLLAQAQQSVLERARQAIPERYAAAKHANAGSGSAYPDGFSITVSAVKSKGGLSLPLKLTTSLTSDPKGSDSIPKEAKIHALMKSVVDKEGNFSVTEFRLGKRPFPPYEN